MKGQRFILLLLALALTVPVIPLLSHEVEGGKPIFQASIMVLPEEELLNMQKPMDLEVDHTGRIYLLYQTYKLFNWDVYIVHSDDEGLTWSDPVRVDDTLTDGNETERNNNSDQVNPRMTLDADGNIYVVWEDWREWIDDLTTRPVTIRFSRSTDRGVSFTESRIITPPKSIMTWDAFKPDIALNQDGRLFCVWVDEKDAGARKNIWSSYSDDNGDTWSAMLMLNSDGKDYRNHNYPRVAMHGDIVYVTWHDGRDTVLGTKPYLAISGDGGQTFAEEFPITTDSQVGAVREYAYPVVDDEGNLYIAWNDNRAERDEVFFTRSEDNGLTFSQDSRIFALPDETSDMNPHLATMGDGHIAVVWEREVPFEEFMETDIFYLNSSDGGRTWDRMLRVDDTDRRREDGSDQISPLAAFSPNGRALCTWTDSRLYAVAGPQTYDIFFTRHSRSLSNINHLPMLLDPGYTGQMGFDHTVGNMETNFTFKMQYRDEDNDEPGDGFPRLQVYGNPDGTGPVFPDWIEMERENGTSDVYFMDGVWYAATISIPQEGRFYWKMEINDGVTPEVLSSAVFPGPLIDVTPPTLEVTGPEEAVWLGNDRVECSVIVRDTGGAGVAGLSIKYIKSVKGIGYFESPYSVDSFTRIDNDTYEGVSVIKLDPGTDNWVKFEAKDRVGNGPTESLPINIWVDADPPYAVDPSPLHTETSIYGVVNCSITFRDTNPGSTLVNHTGLDPSSIRYAYRTTSGEFSEWLEPDGFTEIMEGSYRAWAHQEFPDEGVYNFIKWRALDLIGNEFITQGYRVNVDIPENYKPVFTGEGHPGVICSPTPHLWWDPAYDEENDPLYYRVQLLKYTGMLQLTHYFDVGKRNYFDVPDHEALEPNFYVLRINVSDMIGGWDIHDHVFQVRDTGTPPPADIAPFGPLFSRETEVVIDWEPSTEAPGDTVYWIRMGTREYLGDLLDWTLIGPATEYDAGSLLEGVGIYSVQVMASSGGNYSRVTQGTVKISDYSLDVSHPSEHTAYRGKDISKNRPVGFFIVNNGTFSDNVTVRLSGELVDRGWAYLNSSGIRNDTYLVLSSRMLTEPAPLGFKIVVLAPEDAETGSYVLNYRVVSEDGQGAVTGTIGIELRRGPDEGSGETFADELSGVITDLLPFLEGVPAAVVIMIFVILIVLIVGGIILLGIFTARRSRKKDSDDPYADQKRIYREIYGKEPTPEELGSMKAQKEGSVEDMIKEGATVVAGNGDAEVPAGASISEDTETDLDLETDRKSPEKVKTGDEETDDLLDRLFD